MDQTFMMKRCPNCMTRKLLSLFGKDRTRSDGRTVYCKACVSSRRSASRVAKRMAAVPIRPLTTVLGKIHLCGRPKQQCSSIRIPVGEDSTILVEF